MNKNFIQKVALSKGQDIIMTYHAQVEAYHLFAYIKCDEKSIALLHSDQASNTLRSLEEYGEVIYRDSIPMADTKALDFLKAYIEQQGGKLL